MGTNYLYAPNDAGALLGGRWWGLFIFVIGVAIGIASNPCQPHTTNPIFGFLSTSCLESYAPYGTNLTQYPLLSLITGIDYYRFPMTRSQHPITDNRYRSHNARGISLATPTGKGY